MSQPTLAISRSVVINYCLKLEDFIKEHNEWWQAAKAWLDNEYGITIEKSISVGNDFVNISGSEQGISGDEFSQSLAQVVDVTSRAESSSKNVRKIDIAWENNDKIRSIAQDALYDISKGIGSWDPAVFSTSVNAVLNNEKSAAGIDLAGLLILFRSGHREYGRKVSYNSSTDGNDVLQLFLDETAHLFTISLSSPEWAQLVAGVYQVNLKSYSITGRMFIIAAILAEIAKPGTQIKAKSDLEKCSTLVKQLSDEQVESGDVSPDSWMKPEWQTRYKELLTGGLVENTGDNAGELMVTKNLSDNPALHDMLSRKSLAQYLANRLRYVYEKDVKVPGGGGFFMNIDGEWGSGKSTLLGFIKHELEKDGNGGPGWISVDFNAWENQRLDPPWWFMMQAVYHGIIKSLKKEKKKGRWKAWRIILNEYKWRLDSGTNNLTAVAVTFILFITVLLLGITNKEGVQSLWVTGPITLIGFLWSLTKFLRSSLVPGSAKAAQSFIEEHGRDPMRVLANHFSSQVIQSGKPIAIFIDDLDRCNKDYGIKLLEGLQTIFRSAPVVYVIAADKKWLSVMFEKQYEVFAPAISRKFKPLGLIFLDKIFQLIVELPNVSTFQKRIYWDSLLNVIEQEHPSVTKEEVVRIQATVQNAKTNAEKLGEAKKAGLTEEVQQVTREAVVSNLSIEEEQGKIEHQLQKFIDLVESNPRTMKRLINDISTAKAVSYLYKQDVSENQLIGWCIFKLQYPSFAEILWEFSGDMGQIKEHAPANEAEIGKLLDNFSKVEKALFDPVFFGKMKFE